MSEYCFSRVTPRADLAFSQIEKLARLDAYGQHQAVWQLFNTSSTEARTPMAFLFRHEWQEDLPAFYVLSRQAPEDNRALWSIQSKPYAPRLIAGEPLHFKLRANPVVTRNGKRHDVVMDTKQRLGWKELGPAARPTLNTLAYEAGYTWFASRAEKHGFTLSQANLLVDGYRAHTVHRRGCVPISFSTLEFSGVLIVQDPDKFVRTLYEGLGPAKGFGCGFVLVKRV